jgi:integrase
MKMRGSATGTEVMVLPATAGELAPLAELADQAADLAEKALSERTRKEYERCWRRFEAWCEKYGFTAMPAKLDTIAMYVTWLAKGHGRQKPLAISSINQALAAIKRGHSWQGHDLNTSDPVIQRVWAGARREIAKTRTVRRVSPVMETDLREILEMLSPDILREARDAAILALGFGAALRRSELVGLDWYQLGEGSGFLTVDERGLLVTLMTSKASQATAEEVIVPRTHAMLLCAKVEAWVELGGIARGTPLFRPIAGNTKQGHHVMEERFNARSIPRVVKRRAYELYAARNKDAGKKKLSARDLKAKVGQFSGHSMRVGHVTSASNRGVNDAHIQKTTRHKTRQMISVYTRVTDAVRHSSLKGSDL